VTTPPTHVYIGVLSGREKEAQGDGRVHDALPQRGPAAAVVCSHGSVRLSDSCGSALDST